MKFEDILSEVGDYNFYQKRIVYIFLIPSAVLLPLFCMTTLFMVASPDHWCYVPELQNLSIELQYELIRPKIDVEGQITFDKCNMYDIDYDDVAESKNLSLLFNGSLASINKIPCKYGWSYDHTNYDETAVTHLNLVCDRSYYSSLILSIGGIGTLFGTPIFGWLSDRFGRRKAFYMTVFTFLFSTLSPTFFRSLTSFIVFRIINGTILPSIYQIPFIALIEMVGPSSRTTLNGIANTTWVIGLSFLPLLAYLTRNWVALNICTSIAGFGFLLFWKILPESPRWLLSRGRFEEAAQVLAEIARVNGKPVPEDLIMKLKSVASDLESDLDPEHFEKSSKSPSNPFLELLKKPGMRYTFLLITSNWIAVTIAYGGIHYNIYNFHGNEFINFFLLAIIELPSYFMAWYLMETRLGRRWSVCLFMFCCGLSLCIPAILPSSYQTIINIVTLIGKFCVSAAFMVIYQQAAELYPTPVRNQGLGAGSMISSVISIFLPYLAYLGQFGVWIPLIIMGLTNIFASFLSSLVPETLNEILPQNLEDGESFGRGKNYFRLAKKKLLTHQIDNNKDNDNNTNIIETLNLKEYNYIDDTTDDDNHQYNKKS